MPCEKRLQGWRSESSTEPPAPTPVPSEAETIVIDKPLSQANIVLGHVGVRARAIPTSTR